MMDSRNLNSRTILLIICLILGLYPRSSSAQVQVGATTSVNGTGDTAQRRLFTTPSGEQWALFFNGTAVEYASSSDGIMWSSRGTLPYASTDFSVSFRSISGTDYVFIAIRSGFDVVVRRGIVTTGSIAFGPEVVAFDGTSLTNSYQAPSITVSSNNHLWREHYAFVPIFLHRTAPLL